jgi:hypothetical protein
MSESSNGGIGSGDRPWGTSVVEAMADQSKRLATFLMLRPREEREMYLQERIAYISSIRNDTWRRTLHLLDGALSREVLLEPKQYSPLFVYHSASFSLEYAIDSEHYFVQPRVITDKCEQAYNRYRDWFAEDDSAHPDVDFLRGLPGLTIGFSFFRQTNQEFDPSLMDADYAGIDEEGFVVLRDRKLDTVVGYPERIIGTEELTDIPEDDVRYASTFMNLIMYYMGVKRISHEQAILTDQLSSQHIVLQPFQDFEITEKEPGFVFPRV